MTSHYVTFAILGGLFITAVFFNVSAAVNNEAGQVDQEGETDLESSLPFCPPSLEDEAARNNNVLIVSTLDGKITALDPSRDDTIGDSIMWTVSTEPGDMISSTISQMELTNNAKWVKLIPSLAGGLYKFDGETIEPVPLSAETLLKTSFKFADNTIITGGKESRTYGIEMVSGKVRYECSIEGCQNFYGDDNMDDVLVVQRETQTVRAVEPRTGQEKWNFSVSQHHLEFNAGLADLCRERPVDEKDAEALAQKKKVLFKAVVSDGIICSVDQSKPDTILWKHKFGAPIVHAWQIKGGRLVTVDLFSTSHLPRRKLEGLGEKEDDLATNDEDGSGEKPLLYIGSHNKQVYIQESSNAVNNRLNHPLKDGELIDGTGDTRFPRVSWRPYLISANSRTPIFNHGGRIDKSNLPLLSFDKREAENTALAVFSGSEYPFDSGLYLYPEEPELEYDPVLNYDKTGDSKVINVEDDENSKDNEDSGILGSELPGQQSIQIVFVSIWYWWKEIIFISFITAVMMNWIISKPIINKMRANFRRKLEKELQNQNQNVTREVVMVEVPVPIERGPNNSNNTENNKSAAITPDTNSSGSLREFSWSRSEDGEFVSRYLEDFEPVQCLGKGGFGVVFESKNKIDDNHYAVKRIKMPQVEADKRKVMREVKCLAKLDHKNIVRYYNTWLEKPPPGWQEDKDKLWKTVLDNMSTRTALSPGGFSQSEAPTETSTGLHVRFDHSISNNTFSKPSTPPRRANNPNDSFSIVFESEETSNHDEEEEVAEELNVQRQSSVTSDCDDALEWEEKKRKQETSVPVKSDPVYLYIVMQLCQKESLRDWLRSCTVERNRQRSLHLFHEICLGVEYVHAQGLIHRDLKPSNIFFSADGTIKIGDFGLVTGRRETNNDVMDARGDSKEPDLSSVPYCYSDRSQHTDQVGTELYMSPEQLARKPYDHKVDIYSLGLILFELLVPFSTQMERVCTLSNLRKVKFPTHFENQEEYPLVKAMLSHNPEARPETSDVLGTDFMQTVEEEMLNEGIGDTGVMPGRRKRKSTSGSFQEE